MPNPIKLMFENYYVNIIVVLFMRMNMFFFLTTFFYCFIFAFHVTTSFVTFKSFNQYILMMDYNLCDHMGKRSAYGDLGGSIIFILEGEFVA